MLRAIAFAEDAVEDRKRTRHGRWIRLAAKRFLSDLRKAHRKRAPFMFSAARARQWCAFIERLPHVEGDWGGRNTIVLEPAQLFFVVQLAGFRNLDGTRRFTTALFAVARKNAKSTLAAGVLLAALCLEHETGPQILSAATTGDQARIVWNIAKRMVEMTPALQEAFDLEANAKAIVRFQVGGTFRPINAKASTQDGLNPSAICFDELHAHKNADLYNVLRSAAGARKAPLFLYTTTEGYENPGPWADVRKFAFDVLLGLVKADHYLALYFALDDEDDDFDETKWVKANPLLGVSVQMSKLREYAVEAKSQPGALGEFRIKRLNRRASASQGFVNLWRWRRCSGPVDLEKLAGQRCWAALDLASTTDMAAWRLLWLVDQQFYTWGRFWVPEASVAERTSRGAKTYESWVRSGHLIQTPEEVIDYSYLKRDILEDCRRFTPSVVGYDPWNALQFAQELVSEGLPMQAFIQGTRTYQPAMSAFERAYTAGRLHHGGDPVLTWNAANLVARTDVNMNKAPDRKRSSDKIDGIVSLIMAFGLAEADDGASFDEFLARPVSA